MLLGIEKALLSSELRYEEVANHGTFPHLCTFPDLYGSLNLEAVVQAWPFEPKPDGSFKMPCQA